MAFHSTPLSDAYYITQSPISDERGSFAEVFRVSVFEEHGLNGRFLQCNHSVNRYRGTLRGLHFQFAPYQEEKLVSCIRGAILDVMVDIRPDSPTFGQHFALELTPENRTMMYVPKGFAHAFQTLTDDTEVMYWVTQYYEPNHQGGVAWDDPALAIAWPLEPTVMSDRDREHPALEALKPRLRNPVSVPGS